MEAQKAQQPSWLIITGLVAVIWTSLWSLSMLMTASPYDSVWFPPAGITVVALLLYGLRAAPGILIAIIFTTYFNDFLFGANASLLDLLKGASGFFFTHITVFWLYTLLFRKTVRRIIRRNNVERTKNPALTLVIAFIAMALASSFTNAWVGINALVHTDLLETTKQQALFWSWGIGDAAGLIVVAPICFGFLGAFSPRVRKSLLGMSFQDHPVDKGPVLAKTAIALVFLLIALAANTLSNSILVGGLIFAPFIPLLWIALTESPAMSAASLAGFTFLTALFVDSAGLIDNKLIYQSALIIMAIMTWLIIAIRTGAMRTNDSV